jgi:hypothetical protein
MERLSIGAKVQHPSFGEGVIFGINLNFIKVFFKEHGDKEAELERIKMTTIQQLLRRLNKVELYLIILLNSFGIKFLVTYLGYL